MAQVSLLQRCLTGALVGNRCAARNYRESQRGGRCQVGQKQLTRLVGNALVAVIEEITTRKES